MNIYIYVCVFLYCFTLYPLKKDELEWMFFMNECLSIAKFPSLQIRIQDCAK